MLEMIRPDPASQQATRFGVFDVDPVSGELRKRGVRVKLQTQPFRILLLLLERPGEVVTRGMLYERLWASKGTFVESEHGLNASIAKLRQALGDSAENPRFIETLPRRGYRFIASVESLPGDAETAATTPVQDGIETPTAAPPLRSLRVVWIGLALTLGLFTAAWWAVSREPRPLPPPYMFSLTTDQGVLVFPALSPDGR